MGNDVAAPFGLIQVKELRVIGSNMYTGDDFKAVIEALASGRIRTEGFITKRFPIEEMSAAMRFADQRPEPLVKVVLEF